MIENETVEQTRKRYKWKNDDYICRGHIINGMSDSVFDVYQNVNSAKELWDSVESKYMIEDASNKKFLISTFMNYNMVDSRPLIEQYNELLRILGQFVQHNLKMDASVSVYGLQQEQMFHHIINSFLLRISFCNFSSFIPNNSSIKFNLVSKYSRNLCLKLIYPIIILECIFNLLWFLL